MSRGGLSRLIRQSVAAAVQPLCIQVDENGRVQALLGDPAYYGYDGLEVGVYAADILEFLVGLEVPATIAFPFIATPSHRCARVTINFGLEYRYVLLLEVTEELDREQRLQKAVNAHVLAQSRADKALRNYSEANARLDRVEQNLRWVKRRRKMALETVRDHVMPLVATFGAVHGDTATSALRSQMENVIAMLDDGQLQTARNRAGHESVTPVTPAVPTIQAQDPDQLDMLILDGGLALAPAIARELGTRGFLVQVMDCGAVTVAELTGEPRLVGIACTSVEVGRQAMARLKDLQRGWRQQPAIVLLAQEDTFDMRMLARRTGARAFYGGPLRLSSITADLTEIITAGSIERCRVVLLTRDTDYEQSFVRSGLQHKIDIIVCPDARQALSAVVEQQPQAVVVDSVTSQIDATDLIEMIRQDGTVFALPIVALIEGRVLDAPLIYLTTTVDECSIKWKDQDVLMASLVSRAQRYRRAWTHSRRDRLTGLKNRQAFLEAFELELLRVNRGQSFGCLALIDIDDFKSINDTHGHAAGNAVLRKLAGLALSRLRGSDLVARYAGDELIVYLSEMLTEEARQLLDDLRASAMNLPVPIQTGDLKFTISGGLQELRSMDGQAVNADRAIAAAEQLLCEAKRLGPNRVCTSQ